MPYEVRRLGEEPIIVTTLTDPIDWARDIKQTTAQVAALVAEIDGEGFRITDLTRTNVTFSELMMGLAAVLRSEGGWLSTPRIQPLVVTTQELGREFQTFAAEQEQYGRLHIELFPTLDEAIAYAREQLSAREQSPAAPPSTGVD
jgi:hypothetical protein